MPTNGYTAYPVAIVGVGCSAPRISTASAGSPISSSASRSAVATQVGLALVVATARKRDLAGMAAEVVAALGEHGVELAVLDVERNEHRRVGAPADLERIASSGVSSTRRRSSRIDPVSGASR